MPAPLGVTGATGQLGGRVARLLAGAGVEQRLLCRSPQRAPDLPGATVARAAYADRDAVRRALDGLEVVLMVSAAESPDRVAEHAAFVDAAVAAGVRHLVYVSFFGASPEATFTLARDHHATERHLQAAPLAWTVVRDNLYADVLPQLAGEDGVLRGPADGGRVSAVGRDDVAAVLAAVLGDPAAHEQATYSLTGPEALTLAEAAATMTRVLGRDYSFRDETPAEALASRSVHDAPPWQVEAWVSTYTAIAAGELAEVTGDVELLTGRPATALDDVLRRLTPLTG